MGETLKEGLEPTLEDLNRQVAILSRRVEELSDRNNLALTVPIHVFDGGMMPIRGSVDAAGLDVMVRAVVDPASKPTQDNPLRECLVDFRKTEGWKWRIPEQWRERIVDDPAGRDDHYGICVFKGEKVAVGLGFAVAMESSTDNEGVYYGVYERSGLPVKGIRIVNDASIVDADYRGEAMAIVHNESGDTFTLGRGFRIAQVIFQRYIKPNFVIVSHHGDLSETDRGLNGLGSTGLFEPEVHGLAPSSENGISGVKRLFDSGVVLVPQGPYLHSPYERERSDQDLDDFPGL